MRAFLFDKDGTLLDSEVQWFMTFEKYLRTYGLEHCTKLHANMLGTSTVACAKTLQNAFSCLPQDTESTQLIAAELLMIFQQIRRELGVHPMPGASALLKRCHLAEHPMAIVTSADRLNAIDDLGFMGWRAYFSVVVTGDDVTRRKPAPDPYLLAATQLGVAPQDCVAIEDGEHGVQSALSAGMRVVMIRDRRFHPHAGHSEAHHVVETLEGLTPADLSRV